jgi:GR25 family glycosyltransferase involved in LPS biosynthesis
MNASRIRWGQTVSFLHALNYTKGGQQLPFEIFDAVAMSEEEAKELQFETNAQRAVAEAIAESRSSW